jgi:hypothetical protein
MDDKSKAPPPMVAGLWEDARVVADGTWVENKQRPYIPHLVHQVGFILLDEPAGIHMVSAWHPELTAAPDQIPRGMIRSITPLGPVLTKRRRSR